MNRKTKQSAGNPSSNVFVHIFLIVTAIITMVPLFTIVITSIRTEKDAVLGPFSIPHEFSLFGNYIEAWTIGNFQQYIFNSVYLVVFSVAGTLIVSTLAGYSFAKFKYPGRNFLYFFILFGLMIPFQTIMLPLYFLLKSLGLLNSLTGIALISFGNAFAIMLMRSFFISLPDSMIEASRIDGCGELRILISIILPNTFPAWASLIVFIALGAWNNLLPPMLFLFDQTKYPVPYAMFAFSDAHTTKYTLLAAAMVISILPILILYLIFNKNFQLDLLAGSEKG